MNESLQTVPAVISFDSMTFEEQKQHFLHVAKKALPLWDYPQDSTIKLLNITENATYRIEHSGYEPIVMRVHRLNYAEKDSIMTEISWILDLRKDTSLHLATPLKSKKGSYIQTIETPELNERRHVVCFSYEKGKAPVDSHDDTATIGKIASVANKIPNRITLPVFRFAAVAYDKMNKIGTGNKKGTLSHDDIAMYRKLGEIAAIIHTHSKSWNPPDFYARIEWDWDATFGDGWNNFYGAHYRDLKILNEMDLETIDACAYLMKKRIDAYGKSPDRYGMIHSDLRMANLLQNGSEITVLDFDDCGRGWYMYDIAGIVGFMEHRPDLPAILSEILIGYRKKAYLSKQDELELPTFIMMRRIGLLQAMIYHVDNTSAGAGESAELSPEILAFYAKGTVVLARQYIRNFKKLPLPRANKTREEGTYHE